MCTSAVGFIQSLVYQNSSKDDNLGAIPGNSYSSANQMTGSVVIKTTPVTEIQEGGPIMLQIHESWSL
jgi:hypothetical protein